MLPSLRRALVLIAMLSGVARDLELWSDEVDVFVPSRVNTELRRHPGISVEDD